MKYFKYIIIICACFIAFACRSNLKSENIQEQRNIETNVCIDTIAKTSTTIIVPSVEDSILNQTAYLLSLSCV